MRVVAEHLVVQVLHGHLHRVVLVVEATLVYQELQALEVAAAEHLQVTLLQVDLASLSSKRIKQLVVI
jgi:hypothetical protein